VKTILTFLSLFLISDNKVARGGLGVSFDSSLSGFLHVKWYRNCYLMLEITNKKKEVIKND